MVFAMCNTKVIKSILHVILICILLNCYACGSPVARQFSFDISRRYNIKNVSVVLEIGCPDQEDQIKKEVIENFKARGYRIDQLSVIKTYEYDDMHRKHCNWIFNEDKFYSCHYDLFYNHGFVNSYSDVLIYIGSHCPPTLTLGGKPTGSTAVIRVWDKKNKTIVYHQRHTEHRQLKYVGTDFNTPMTGYNTRRYELQEGFDPVVLRAIKKSLIMLFNDMDKINNNLRID